MKIRQKIQELIKEYNITEVVLEDIQMEKGVGNNVITFKALAEVIGVITELLAELKIPFKIIPSSTWRCGLDIKGNQRKVYKKVLQKKIILKLPRKMNLMLFVLELIILEMKKCPLRFDARGQFSLMYNNKKS